MPSLGMITLNALTAADGVIIPVQAQYLPAKGMTQLLQTITRIKKHTNPKLNNDGILLTLVDGRTNLAKSTVEALRENFGKILRYQNHPKVKIVWGDLLQYEKVRKCIKDVQLVFHVAALVSPAADYDPELTMQVNYGSTRNIVRAIKELGQANLTKLVYIGSVAETGDRRPPIHWGRIGDPIKPSILDYYAVSKVAAERYVIESSLSYWVSLRQTGMMSPAMAQVEDPIMFHNGLWNGLEYISVRDSGRLLCNICHYERENALDRHFWGHIFNIGGGKDCRISTYNLFREMFEQIGLKDVSRCIDMKWFATENFHGHYYLDSDRLENILHFQKDTMQYFYQTYWKKLRIIPSIMKEIIKLPNMENIVAKKIMQHFRRIASKEHAPWYAMEHQQEESIVLYWGSLQNWNEIKSAIDSGIEKNMLKGIETRIEPRIEHGKFEESNDIVWIDHGYDETKAEEELTKKDMDEAVKFRGGRLLSMVMKPGDWSTALRYECAFGHQFSASPRLILEGGHWCPICEQESWNYGERAKRDPFFHRYGIHFMQRRKYAGNIQRIIVKMKCKYR